MTTAALEHVHQVYRSDDELADMVAQDVTAALAHDDAVLVCLPAHQAAAVAGRLGSLAADVTYLAGDDRYARPIDAMSALWDFVQDAVAGGHARAHSIGAIAFAGTEADTPWLRYEVAVNEIFRDLPLRAVCLVNDLTTPDPLLGHLDRVHDHARLGDEERDQALQAQRRLLRHLPASIPLPDDPAAVVTPGPSSAARRSIATAFEAVVSPDAVHDLQLIATELLVNARRHGGGDAVARLWHASGQVVVAVTDAGAGPREASAGLRPAQLSLGGRGLWIVHQLCASVDFVVDEHGHSVVATYPLPD